MGTPGSDTPFHSFCKVIESLSFVTICIEAFARLSPSTVNIPAVKAIIHKLEVLVQLVKIRCYIAKIWKNE